MWRFSFLLWLVLASRGLCDWRGFPSNVVGLHLHTVVGICIYLKWTETAARPGCFHPCHPGVSVQSFPPRTIRGGSAAAAPILLLASRTSPARPRSPSAQMIWAYTVFVMFLGFKETRMIPSIHFSDWKFRKNVECCSAGYFMVIIYGYNL